jgi:germination protein M
MPSGARRVGLLALVVFAAACGGSGDETSGGSPPSPPSPPPPPPTVSTLEEALPAIVVESPAPGATVTSPLAIRGTANTFEATFMVELRPEQGEPLYKNFVTATSGNGTRGTFEKTLDFAVDREQPGTLVVYENSAEDGSVMNEVQIPVTIRP